MFLFSKVIFEKKEIQWCTDVLYGYFVSKDPRYEAAKEKVLSSWPRKIISALKWDFVVMLLLWGFFLGFIFILNESRTTSESGGGLEKILMASFIAVGIGTVKFVVGAGSFFGYRSKVNLYFKEFEALATESKDWTTFAYTWIRKKDPYFFKEYYTKLRAKEELIEQMEVEKEEGLVGRGAYQEGMREGWWRFSDLYDVEVKAGFYEDNAMIFGITYDENQKPNGFWHDK